MQLIEFKICVVACNGSRVVVTHQIFFIFIVITPVLFDQSSWNKDKIIHRNMIHKHTKTQEGRYNIFWGLLVLSQFYGDESDVLHGFLPFIVATSQTSKFPSNAFMRSSIFRSFAFLWNISLLNDLKCLK